MLRGISASSTSCRFHCPTNCTNSGSLVLGAQIVHSNEDDGKLALSLKKKKFTFPPLVFAHFWAFIHPTSSTHRSFTDPPLMDPTSIPHRPTPHRPYILLSFQDNLFVMIPTLNSEAVHHHHISIVFPPPPPPPHFSVFSQDHHHISIFSSTTTTTTTFQLFSLTTTTASLLFSLHHHHQHHISIDCQHHYKAIK